jgi:hypothetical protein
MLESELSCELILYWIIFRLTAVVINLGSIKNGVSLVDRCKGVGVVATARVKRRHCKFSRMS